MAQSELLLPYGFAKRHGVLAESQDDYVLVRHRPDTAMQVFAELQRSLNKPLALESLSIDDFDRALTSLYNEGDGNSSDMMLDLGDNLDLNDIDLPEPEDLLESADEAPIIRLINMILTQAVKRGASDIHIEPFEQRLSVRLRVDGVLAELIDPPRAIAGLIVSRIKVMAKLDIAEKRLPQDGRISLKLANHAVDIRVSTLPSGHGERVVLRLLDKQAGRLDLAHLGMQPHTHQLLRETIHKPHGIILVTGPTGSGKTTTLYAGLGELNDKSRNILTVEDPVEYFIDGIGQTQVNSKVNMSFARGLRAILRQDPDVVMVGEIRDLETADIAVQASLTGHMVLSTLHTNTAVGAVTRLRDMGVEPFLLSSTLLASVAQRLVRLLCNDCKQAAPASDDEMSMLGLNESDERPMIHHPVGCPSCNGSGYLGRSGLYEIVLIDETMRQLIHDGATEDTMEKHARTKTQSIRDDGLRRILAGDTSIEEVLRVTRGE